LKYKYLHIFVPKLFFELEIKKYAKYIKGMI